MWNVSGCRPVYSSREFALFLFSIAITTQHAETRSWNKQALSLFLMDLCMLLGHFSLHRKLKDIRDVVSMYCSSFFFVQMRRQVAIFCQLYACCDSILGKILLDSIPEAQIRRPCLPATCLVYIRLGKCMLRPCSWRISHTTRCQEPESTISLTPIVQKPLLQSLDLGAWSAARTFRLLKKGLASIGGLGCVASGMS